MSDENQKEPSVEPTSTDEKNNTLTGTTKKETTPQAEKASEPQVGPNQAFYNQLIEERNKTTYSEEEVKQEQEAWHSFEEEKRIPKIHDFPAYFFAGFWIRGFAFIIDILCIQAITSISIGSIFSVAGWTKDSYFWSIYALMSLLIYLAYFILVTKLTNGQTIGKMIFGIQVISFDEEKLSWQTVLIREGACRFILKYPLLMIGYLPTIFSGKKQHIGDFLSNTSVVTINTVLAFNKQVKG